MSDEAAPIVKAYWDANTEHPEGGDAFKKSFDTKIKEVKERSIEERKQGHLRHRLMYEGNMTWAGIDTQEDFDKSYHEAFKDYRSGNFFLQRIGRYREVDAPLTMTILGLRGEWIKEYEIKTAPEYMLLDMALTSYFH